jgi:pimeloyl-ACP methyl ester carboxylesterase
MTGTGTIVNRITVNGVELDVHEAGDRSNPTVLLCHGFPESAYSWRHQMSVVAGAGFHVVAPDQRGYARSAAPREVDAYGITDLTGDLFALLDHYGKDDAVFVGHDWGAIIVWEAAKLNPSRVRAVCGVSVPFVQWPAPPTQLMKMVYGDHFFYILYFPTVGTRSRPLPVDGDHPLRGERTRDVGARPVEHRAAADGRHRLPHRYARGAGPSAGRRGRPLAHRRRPAAVRQPVRLQRLLRAGELLPQPRRQL